MNDRIICKGCFELFTSDNMRLKYCSRKCKRLTEWEWQEARLLDLGSEDEVLEKHRRYHPRYGGKRQLSANDKADMESYRKAMVELREARKNVVKDSSINLDRLIERDGGICYICGGKTSDRNAKKLGKAWRSDDNYPTIDHVIPLSRNGTHTWDNVKLAHWKCNKKKGGKLLEAEDA